jgi:epoxyqueuosine reductase
MDSLLLARPVRVNWPLDQELQELRKMPWESLEKGPLVNDTLASCLKAEAQRLGFARVGVAAACEADGFEFLRAWLDQGYAGDMAYMHKHAEQRRHPRAILAQVRSVLMVTLPYAAEDPEPPHPSPRAVAARIARYARGPDYHDVIWERLNALRAWLEQQVPGSHVRGVCDTAPLLERDFARRAGLGWFGRNTMLIDKRAGSYFLLGALLTDVELPADPPFTAQHCGTCTACLDACPTNAFPASGVLDARRCISYLTIELRRSIPDELRHGIGDWLFGCDVCQEVCPWNRHAAPGHPALAQRPELTALDPVELLSLSEAEFRRRFRGTALFRARRAGLLRNAALVLGNSGGPEVVPALRQALQDPEGLVREAAAWALEQIEQRQQDDKVTSEDDKVTR